MRFTFRDQTRDWGVGQGGCEREGGTQSSLQKNDYGRRKMCEVCLGKLESAPRWVE